MMSFCTQNNNKRKRTKETHNWCTLHVSTSTWLRIHGNRAFTPHFPSIPISTKVLKTDLSIANWHVWCNTFDESWVQNAICGKKIPGGGHSTFFQVGVSSPDFRSVGLANWHLPLKWGLVSGKFPNLGLVSWKFLNLGACELKITKFGGLWAKIWVKIEAVQAKISKFSQKGVLWTDSFAWNGTLASGRRGVKRGSSGPHIPIPPF